MRRAGLIVNFVLCHLLRTNAVYIPLREYSGISFFDRWGFYANVDNTTWGNVSFVDKQAARAQRLVSTNSQGNAIIRVDNTTFIPNSALVLRDSVRITSIDTYGVGTMVIIDVIHMPYGCSVWPSFWTYGLEREWPNAGEIDIIEGINQMDSNQIALHALPGCMKTEIPGQQTGTTLETNCSSLKGCIVKETKPNSFGAAFAKAGGGAYAMQFASSGIYIWFWSRPDIPTNVKNANSSSKMNTTLWGIPTASYPSTACDFSYYFPPQSLVLVTTLCGGWAGDNSSYLATCNGSCVANNIVGSGSNYAQAYWEIKYIRTYYDEQVGPPVSSSASPSISSTGPILPSRTSDSLTVHEYFPQFIIAFCCLFFAVGLIFC